MSIFTKAKIILPKEADMTKWSVVACDQYTSERDYWERVESFVGEAPSTLKVIFPEVYLEDEGIAGSHFLVEGNFVYLKEVGRVFFGFVEHVHHKQTAALREGFDDEHTGHYRLFGEVAVEEGFVDGYVLDTYYVI